MKSVLGSILLAVALFGNANVWVSTTEPYVKQPVILKLTYADPEPQRVVWVKFAPKSDGAFESHFLHKSIEHGRYTFVYLLFPLKEGEIDLHYSLQLKKSAIEEIRQDILGTGYEQTNPIEGKIFTIPLAPTHLHVKHVAPVDLYGSFTLHMQIDKKRIQSFEPLYLQLRLEGKGYPPKVGELVKVAGVKVLKDKPQKRIIYTKEGAKIAYLYRYALISDHNFTIPPITLKEFDFHSYKKLTTPPAHIEVVMPKQLLDEQTSPPKIEPVFAKVKSFLLFVAIFFAGMLSGVVLYVALRRREVEEILLAKDHNELLALLVVRYPHCFAEQKEALERKEHLAKIKKEIIKGLKRCNSSR